MKIGPRLSRLVLALALGCTALGTIAAEPDQFSDAEKLVFTDPQLANLKEPTSLRYSFVKSGTLETGFSDEVRVDVATSGKTCCLVKGSFLSGERALMLPEIPDAEANPVILYFLEHDIREMQRLTKGRSVYYQKRIRMTMVNEAQVRDTTVSWQGRTLPAQEVTLTPYQTDPARSRYERFSNKRYTFVLAKDVPGGVYQIRTVMSGAQAGDPAMIEEVMTFTGTAADPTTATTTPR